MTGQKTPKPGSKTPQGGKQSPEPTSLDAGADSVPEGRPASDPGSLPETFGRYRILRKLGEGGMGSVYLAHDSQFDGLVALKIPRFSSGHEQDGVTRFFREARAAFRIRHPGICPVYDVGEIDGQHYISMAYIEGHTLSSVNKPMGEKQATRIIGQLARALQAAHREGITHRDMKPANVMIDEEQNPIIMDFGLARRETTEESRLTKTGAILGTPCYMPIEQVQGEWGKIGPHTDIYSLGVMLYELLTETLPFEGSPWEVLGQIVTQQPQPPSQRNPNVDPRLEAICLKAMAKQIEDRYASMAELSEALKGCLTPPTSEQTQRSTPAKPKRTRQRESQRADRIEVQCPNGHRLTANESRRGKRVKCPTCSTQFVIPKKGAETSRTAAVESVAVSDSDELITNSIGMKLQLIPAGEFLMGSVDADKMADDDEKPQHLVKITKPFYLSVYEVTQRQYAKVMGVRPWQGKQNVQEGPEFPATYVSWSDAVEFCNRLSEQESIQPYYKINKRTFRTQMVSVVGGSGYRLPTEAEWEYACRAGTTTVYSFGDDASELGQYAWYDKNAWDIDEQYAHRVGQKLPNSWGLYDMHGNVYEWCQDWFAPYGSEKALTDPTGPAQDESRVLRGGSFFSLARDVRSAYRLNNLPANRYYNYGFRAARTYR